MKRIFAYFMRGLVLLAPVVITFYSIFLVFDFADRLVRDPMEEYLGFQTPGIGILVLFVVLTILGLVGQSILIKPISFFFSRLLDKAPLIKVVYTSLNDLFTAFVGKEKKFNHPVLVCVNKENNLWKMGFLTEKSLGEFGMDEMVAVYFPHSYNFSGELFLVPAESVKPVDLKPAEVMKFVVSAGVTKVN